MLMDIVRDSVLIVRTVQYDTRATYHVRRTVRGVFVFSVRFMIIDKVYVVD